MQSRNQQNKLENINSCGINQPKRKMMTLENYKKIQKSFSKILLMKGFPEIEEKNSDESVSHNCSESDKNITGIAKIPQSQYKHFSLTLLPF